MNWWSKNIDKFKAAIEVEKEKRSPEIAHGVCIHGDEVCVRCAGSDFESQQSTPDWQTLDEADVRRVVTSLAPKVVLEMKKNPGDLVLAGGYIRAIIGNEAVNDVDLFVNTMDEAKDYASWINCSVFRKKDLHYTTTDSLGREVQVIARYTFKDAGDILEKFDYTVAKSAIWFDDGSNGNSPGFKSICHERFYRDLAKKALVYDSTREHERVEGILRLLKFASYGYRIDPKSLAEVFTKTCLSLDLTNGFESAMKYIYDAYKPLGTDEQWLELSEKIEPPKPTPQPTPRPLDYGYGS